MFPTEDHFFSMFFFYLVYHWKIIYYPIDERTLWIILFRPLFYYLKKLTFWIIFLFLLFIFLFLNLIYLFFFFFFIFFCQEHLHFIIFFMRNITVERGFHLTPWFRNIFMLSLKQVLCTMFFFSWLCVN